MNKKGFTLVEVLAIIVVLSILMLMVLPKINESTDTKKQKQYDLIVKTIINAAKVYHSENPNNYIIKLSTLVSNNYLDNNINPVTNTNFTGCVKVVLEDNIYSYIYEDTLCETASETIVNLYNNLDPTIVKYTYDDLYEDTTDEVKHTIYRYVGGSDIVNNYVTFNNETWRIIGVFDDKLKIIRENYLTSSSYDSSSNEINSGNGINNWNSSKLSTNLNDYYYGTNSTYYYCNDRLQSECVLTDETFTKINNISKKIIDKDHLWYVGSSNNSYDSVSTVYTSLDAFINEHRFIGKICETSSSCNDNVSRNLTWLGEVGLMSLSDYSYAGNCSDYTNCSANNWLAKADSLFINPATSLDNAYSVWMTNSDSNAVILPAYTSKYIYPVVYLSTNIYFASGTGTSSNPYTLAIDS